MDTLRNVSMQSLILQKPGGGNVQLLPGRAITLSAEELQGPQIQSMLKSRLVEVETRDARRAAAPGEPHKPAERRRSTEPALPKTPAPK
jgi:hypothetical protein